MYEKVADLGQAYCKGDVSAIEREGCLWAAILEIS